MWAKLLTKQGRPLSKNEIEAIQKYESDPKGRHFYQVAQLLYGASFEDEATEIMMSGVAEHPDYLVARITLSSYLYRKKLFFIAWQTLDHAATSEIEGNILGWSMRFKLALALGYESHASEAAAVLTSLSLTAAMDQLVTTYTLHGPEAALEILAEELLTSSTELTELVQTQSKGFLTSITSPPKYHEAEPLGESDKGALSGFYAVPLREVFGASSTDDTEVTLGGSELDSLTLAEIFEKQHCYERAASIYRRLLAKNPAHEGIKKRMHQLEQKWQQDKLADAGGVEEVLDDLHEKRFLDNKSQFLQSMLEGITRS